MAKEALPAGQGTSPLARMHHANPGALAGAHTRGLEGEVPIVTAFPEQAPGASSVHALAAVCQGRGLSRDGKRATSSAAAGAHPVSTTESGPSVTDRVHTPPAHHDGSAAAATQAPATGEASEMLATPGPMPEQTAELTSISAGGPQVPPGVEQVQAAQTGGSPGRSP
jgi:hypothetical protein